MPLFPFGEHPFLPPPAQVLFEEGLNPGFQCLGQGRIAGYAAQIQQGGQKRKFRTGHIQAFVQGLDRIPHFITHIPERVEDFPDDFFGRGFDGLGEKKEQIDIRKGG